MEMLRISVTTMTLLGIVLSIASVNAQSPQPAPGPSSDGVAIDQGIAYVLMLVALVLTYIIH
ncbi:Arabinogalactan protein 16/20/22/41 [Dillenia turbinata]|uniref:Arabinogalactan protein 16/20/22/41 n=1 Tax=Dillenia turbinata TaxID=194707 RepID=A0AAN8VX16_9MAGN